MTKRVKIRCTLVHRKEQNVPGDALHPWRI